MTGLPVLTAVTGASWESTLVGALSDAEHGLTVVRRCVDLPDLLAVATTGTARAVLLSSDLRRLDREAVTRLLGARVAVVGLIDPGDADSEQRLRALGIAHVLAADAGAGAVSAAVLAAVADLAAADPAGGSAAGLDVGDPRAALPDRVDVDVDVDADADPAGPALAASDLAGRPGLGRGRLLAVWGPTGAPGRTTVAVGVADEAARLGISTLLVDADVYGAVIGQVLGLLDESAGLAVAARQAGNGVLDAAALGRSAWAVTPKLRVLTGIARADRWPELRPSSLETVLEVGRELAALIVVDLAFCVEQDEELSYDTLAPRRNAATLTTLAMADSVLCLSGADPVSLQRTVRALADLRERLPEVRPQVVVNRLRRHVVPGDPRKEIAAALSRFANVEALAYLPQDVAGADAALAAGRTLAEVAPRSPLRLALRALAAQLAGVPAPSGRGRPSRHGQSPRTSP